MEIIVPVPEDADTPRFRTTIGSVYYVPEKSAIVWKIKQFGGGKEFLMRAELGLPSVKGSILSPTYDMLTVQPTWINENGLLSLNLKFLISPHQEFKYGILRSWSRNCSTPPFRGCDILRKPGTMPLDLEEIKPMLLRRGHRVR